MQKRTSGYRARSRWLVPIFALWMSGCPKQELAPLAPCTVSSVREEVNQTGISKVDLMFMIDNSRSMKEEQDKLRKELPRLIRVLTTGDRYIDRESEAVGVPDDERYFTPVSSLQLGVTTSELAVMQTPSNATGTEGCVEGTDPDDGRLLTSVDIAVNGQVVDNQQVIPPNPDCADVDPPLNYLQFETADKTDDQLAADAAETARQFSCISTVGVLGCAYEQQLEAIWKAVAPSTQSDFIDSMSKFGHGNPNGVNKKFVRDDAILAVIAVTDEEDCSIRAAGRVLFETAFSPSSNENEWSAVPLNLRCGTADEMGRDDLIQGVDRYIKGLQGLKPQNPDRVIFAGIVGIPVDLEDEVAAGQYDQVLSDPDMQFRAMGSVPVPSCSSAGGDAYPARRFVQTAQGFGENAGLFSICRDDYGPAIDQIIDRIAAKLKGNCLPRQLTPDDDGLVRCEVYEILPEGMTKCNPSKGHIGAPESRTISQAGVTVTRTACKVQQVPVMNDMPKPSVEGWYYDSFSQSLKEDCPPGEQQRIVFTEAAQLGSGSGATFECFQPVATITANSRGFDAINTPCSAGDTKDTCGDVSDDEYTLICIEALNVCQISCSGDPECPPGWVCATIDDGKGPPPKYCQQPTCQTNPTPTSSVTDGG